MEVEKDKAKKTTKVCPECRSEVDIKAKRCPQCRHKFPRLGAAGVLVALIFAWIIFSVVMSDHSSSTATAPSGPPEASTLGQAAFLRLPDTSDSNRAICLAPNKAVYDEYRTALEAQDYQGLLDLTDQGLFCVHNGSQVKVVDFNYGLTKVRVTKGALPVDNDKVGEAGYTAMEWVVAQ